MGSEIITIHLGQAGVQLSHALWDLVCIEHGINVTGHQLEDAFKGTGTEYVFREVTDRKFVPRALLIDLEPTVIDEIRTGVFRHLWSPQQLISGKEDAASNFARGYYSQTRFELGDVLNRIRIMVEQCESMACFKLLYSANGGTGSGLTSALCERLSDEYGKKYKFATAVYPSPGYSELMVEPYNALLHSSTNLTFCDCVMLTDNEALLNVMEDSLKSRSKGFTLINKVVANAVTTQFLSHRYNFIGQHHTTVSELLTNLIPYPRIHFPIMAFAPIFGPSEELFEKCSAFELLNEVFNDTNQLLSVTTAKRAYISCALLFRGNITPVDAVKAMAHIKGNRLSRARFVDWCPTGFKLGINSSCPIRERDRTGLAVRNSSLSMIAGNLAVRDIWTGIGRRFDLLYNRRAYVHWYVAEGMEEGEFALAREVIQQLVDDYESIARDTEGLGPDTSSNHATSTSNNQFVYKGRIDKRVNLLASRPKVGRAPTLDDQNSLRTFDMNDENILYNANQHNSGSLLMEQNYQTDMNYDGNLIGKRQYNRRKQTHTKLPNQVLPCHEKNTYPPPAGKPLNSRVRLVRADKDSGSSEFRSDSNFFMNYGTNCSAVMSAEFRDQFDQQKASQHHGYMANGEKEGSRQQQQQQQQQHINYKRNCKGQNAPPSHSEAHHCKLYHTCTNRRQVKLDRTCDKCSHTGFKSSTKHHKCRCKNETTARHDITHIHLEQTIKTKPNGDCVDYEFSGPSLVQSGKSSENYPNEHIANTGHDMTANPNKQQTTYDQGTTKICTRYVEPTPYFLVPDHCYQLPEQELFEYNSGRISPATNNTSVSHTNSNATTGVTNGSIQTCPDDFYDQNKHDRNRAKHPSHHHHFKTTVKTHSHRKCYRKTRIQLEPGRTSETRSESFQALSEPTPQVNHEQSVTSTSTEIVFATRYGNIAEQIR